MSEKELIIDPRVLRPLPQSMWNCACSSCDKLQARWELGIQAAECKRICSLCFLYKTRWGQERQPQLLGYLADVEAEDGGKFLRSPSGELISCDDANRVLAGIAFVSRYIQLQQMAQGAAHGLH